MVPASQSWVLLAFCPCPSQAVESPEGGVQGLVISQYMPSELCLWDSLVMVAFYSGYPSSKVWDISQDKRAGMEKKSHEGPSRFVCTLEK